MNCPGGSDQPEICPALRGSHGCGLFLGHEGDHLCLDLDTESLPHQAEYEDTIKLHARCRAWPPSESWWDSEPGTSDH